MKKNLIVLPLLAILALSGCATTSNNGNNSNNNDNGNGGTEVGPNGNEGGENQNDDQHQEVEGEFVKFNTSNPDAVDISCADLYKKSYADGTLYRVTGVINGMDDNRFGSFDITDKTGSICVYGCRSNKSCIAGSGKNYRFTGSAKEFSNLGLKVGDTVTIEGVHIIYGNNKYWKYGEIQGYAVSGVRTNNWKVEPKSYTAPETYSGNYYDSVEGLTGRDFINGLHDLMLKTHVNYKDYTKLDSKLRETDKRDGKLKCFYSNQVISGKFNKEHVWPQSRSSNVFGTEPGAGSDLHHIRATINDNNSTRGNRKFGFIFNKEACNTMNYQGGKPNYYTAEKTNTGTFEPSDSIKGDCARIIAYVYLHYNNFGTSKDLNNGYVGDLYLTNTLGVERSETGNLLRRWNAIDPVDEVEINRNNIAADWQGNRNPFIDHPSYMDIVFA